MTTATATATRAHARARVAVRLPRPAGTGRDKSDPAAVRRILRAYDASSDDTRAAGRSWYADARAICEDIARDTNLPPTIVIAVLAHTSANTNIADNIVMTRKVCEAYRDDPNASLPSVHTADVMGKVDMAIHDYDLSPLEFELTLDGTRTGNMKVRSFYRCVLGDDSYVAVDVWATRVADPSAGEAQPTHKRYRRIEAAYRRAAELRGESAAAMQAIVWCHTRGKAW